MPGLFRRKPPQDLDLSLPVSRAVRPEHVVKPGIRLDPDIGRHLGSLPQACRGPCGDRGSYGTAQHSASGELSHVLARRTTTGCWVQLAR